MSGHGIWLKLYFDSLTAGGQLCQNGRMATVLQLHRRLENRPEIRAISNITVRRYQGEADIPVWLQLRHTAFARERFGVRQWSGDDFLAEFASRWWWQPGRMWLAESIEPAALGSGQGEGAVGQRALHPQLIGTVTLAMRGEPTEPEPARPVVHWLMVQPRWRRHGIGRLLMAHLEGAAWDAGYREIWLETHAAWDAAVKFYQSQGYQSVQR
jgi:GNAT superfamily N-acetyltransferase